VLRPKTLSTVATILVLACSHSTPSTPSTSSIAGEGPPTGIAAFTRHDRFVDAKISPKGRYLAAVSLDAGKRWLTFINLATRKLSYILKFEGETMVGDFFWANDERVIVELVQQDGSLAAPFRSGELYSIDATGRGGRMIFGYRAGGEMPAGTRMPRTEKDFALAFVLAALPSDDRHVLIESAQMRETGDRVIQLFKLDVYKGSKVFLGAGPLPLSSFLADEKGDAWAAEALDEAAREKFFYRDSKGWRDLSTLKGFSARSVPRALSGRDRCIYVEEGGEFGYELYRVNVDTGERRLIAANEQVPARNLIRDTATGQVIAVEYEPDLPTYEFLVPDHPVSQVISGLVKTYPTEHVQLMNTTQDQRKAVVQVYGDRNPGLFFLVDLETKSAVPLVETRPWIRPEAMAEMTPFHIKATDGLRIHGYFTLPQQTPAANLPPLVVLPHGGPHGVRDTWGFHPDVQLFASEGFAVLQVNYRGSGGYGRRYEEAGYRRWGNRMIQDIVDATRWMAGKGLIDGTRVCIMGGSFGGYAALQSAILAPDLFRCAIGYAGVYDLSTLVAKSDMASSPRAQALMARAIGHDEAALKAVSPVYNADKVKAAVFLIHGDKDRRAPVAQAEALRKALEAKGKAVRWLVEPKEGHGFYAEEARKRMYEQVLAFLKENTKTIQATTR